MEETDRKTTTTQPSDTPKGEDKPPIIQPGPIIIKDGGSVEIQSPIFVFKDKDGKDGKEYKCSRRGRITSVIVTDGLTELPEIKPTSGQANVVITFTPS